MKVDDYFLPRSNWHFNDIKVVFEQPLVDLLLLAHTVHRRWHDPHEIQPCRIQSIKTGACPEDCKYCPQSGHYNTGLEKEKLLEVQKVLEEAARAKAIGSTRFC